MAGYKNAILSHDPVLFVTFDGDPFDPISRALIHPPMRIMDESIHANHGVLHVDSLVYHNYRLGMPALTELQTSDMHSCQFGAYGRQPAAPTPWTKAMVEVPHIEDYNFGENVYLGGYTVAFWVNKEADESYFKQNWGGSLSVQVERTFLQKQGLFRIYHRDPANIADTLRVTYLGGPELEWTIPQSFYARDNMIVFTWHVEVQTGGMLLGVGTLYVNGRVVARATTNYVDMPPNTSVTSPVEIAGTIDPAGGTMNDRQTVPTRLDQIAMFSKPLSQGEITRLYRLAKSYDNIIRHSSPSHYWVLNDAESTVNTTVEPSVGTVSGNYYGGVTKVQRNQPGPERIGTGATQFIDGGMAGIHNTSGSWYSPFFAFTADFSIEFWVLVENTNRSVLMSIQRDNFPYPGLVIEANRKNGGDLIGALQVSLSQDHVLNSNFESFGGSLHSGWTHVCITRSGSLVDLRINGRLHDSQHVPIQSVTAPGPGQLYLMGMMPGSLHTRGRMCAVALYTYALQEPEVTMRFNYQRIFRIQGVVTLQGTPTQANVRVYDHANGNMLSEVLSDMSDGDYRVLLYDDREIDLMVLNKGDPNVRYRAYGPIIPAQFEDV